MLFGGGAAFAVLVVGVLLSNFIMVSMEYDKAKREYLAVGLPFEVKDMVRNVPKEQNAATLFSQYKHTSTVASADPKFDSVKANKDELKKLVEGRKVELDAAVEAAKLKHLDWRADWSQGTYMDLAQGMPLKSMIRDLAIRAEIKIIEGDKAGALSDFRAMCRISEMSSQEPTLIAMLVSCALRAMVCTYARKFGSYMLNDSEFLYSLSNELAAVQSGPDMVNAIKGEAYFSVWHLRNMKQLGGWLKAISPPDDNMTELDEPKYTGPFAMDGEIKGIAAKAMAVKAFRFFTDLQTILKKDQNWLTANPKITKRVNEAIKDESLSGRMLSFNVGIYEQILNAPAKNQATALATRASLMLMAFEAEGRGKLKISDLQGDWLDPYTGKALLSAWSGNSLKVWSVGEDGKDDGGATTNPSGFGPPLDIVAELPFGTVKPIGARPSP